jgi:hypothetical protein
MGNIELFNITFSELIVFLILALAFLRLAEIQSLGRWGGRQLRNIVSSDFWRPVQQATRYLRDLPNRMMREAGMEDIKESSGDFDFSIPIYPPDEDDSGIDESSTFAPPIVRTSPIPADLPVWGPPLPQEAPEPVSSRRDDDTDGVHRPASAAFE